MDSTITDLDSNMDLDSKRDLNSKRDVRSLDLNLDLNLNLNLDLDLEVSLAVPRVVGENIFDVYDPNWDEYERIRTYVLKGPYTYVRLRKKNGFENNNGFEKKKRIRK